MKKYILITLSVAVIICSVSTIIHKSKLNELCNSSSYIKWVDFGITEKALTDAMLFDVESYGKDQHISWIELLSLLGAKYGGDFTRYKKSDLAHYIEALGSGKLPEELSVSVKYYNYFKEAYSAVLSGFIGEYTRSGKSYYGLRAFSPIAKGYSYTHYNDFGAARSYGYKREHLGHDIMGNIGTPIVAIESGYVEAIGWNRYGGWRIGIRSFDGKRYYYYAHLRKDHPFTDILEGDIISAGQVIGYMGMTGYSTKENVNNINVPHLHVGLQLIFDSSQKDGTNQIWIDMYELTKFLAQNKVMVTKNLETNEMEAIDPVYSFDIPD